MGCGSQSKGRAQRGRHESRPDTVSGGPVLVVSAFLCAIENKLRARPADQANHALPGRRPLKLVVAIGFAAFFVSSLAIGCRLLWLARRNRGLPELLIGLGILGIGPAGFALTIFAMLANAHPRLVFVTLATAQLAISAGATSAYVFN